MYGYDEIFYFSFVNPLLNNLKDKFQHIKHSYITPIFYIDYKTQNKFIKNLKQTH